MGRLAPFGAVPADVFRLLSTPQGYVHDSFSLSDNLDGLTRLLTRFFC